MSKRPAQTDPLPPSKKRAVSIPQGTPKLAVDAHPRNCSVPLPVRQRALLKMHQEFLALYGTIGKHEPLASVARDLAYDDAFAQEAETFRQSSSVRAGYTTASHTAVLAIGQRDRTVLSKLVERILANSSFGPSASDDAIASAQRQLKRCTETGTQLAVRHKRAAVVRAERSHITAAGLRHAHFVCPASLLSRWRYLTSIPTEWGPGSTATSSEGETKTCDRCKVSFQVASIESAATNGDAEDAETYPPCRFHHGRKRPDPQIGRQRKVWRWTCCGEELRPTESNHESDGDRFCSSAPLHVFREEEPEALHQRIAFIETDKLLPPPCERPDAHDVLSLDCELCYTTAGKSLTQLAILSSEGETIANWLVRPSAAFVDYNTRFSGLSAETYDHAEENGREVLSFEQTRERLLALMHRETILVGHGLENDLSALRLVHLHIVDTAMLFPHERGPPFRQSLRDLVAAHLGRLIQVDTTAGHDAMEDALAPLHLVQAKLAADDRETGQRRGSSKVIEHVSPFDPSNKATGSSPFFNVDAHLADVARQSTATTAGPSSSSITSGAAPRLNAMALMRSSGRPTSSAANKRSRAAVFAPKRR